jgi:5-methylcytosine-specific restriction endonuclease McrA
MNDTTAIESQVVVQSQLPAPRAEVELPQGYLCDCWECSICGRFTTEPYCFAETIICDGCAEVIANHYKHRHSGAWLTWPNAERESSRDTKRREISSATRRRIFERDAYRCRYCGSHLNLTIDHVTPVTAGGLDTDENLVTCCKSCNSSKHARTPEEAGMSLMDVPQVDGEL